MEDRREYQTVVLAALLHDVGKLLQRGDFGPLAISGRHPQVSADFVGAFGERFAAIADGGLLRTLVQRHHESAHFPAELRVQEIADAHVRALAYLVSRADNLSSAEREEARARRDYRTARLATVFGRVSMGGDEPPPALYYRPRPLGTLSTIEEVFPVAETAPAVEEVNRLLEGFGAEFANLAAVLDWQSFDCVLSHLLSLLQKYAWCLPSDTQEAMPDVSLYDHCRTTAAIAACLYRYHVAEGTLSVEGVTRATGARFRLLAGDVSGIQGYIYDIAAVEVGGVARRLRARSLFVHLLTEVACHRLLRALDLPLANVLMSSGGKFYLLAPNTAEAATAIESVQREADEWLLRELNGELCLNIASVALGDEGFQAGRGSEGGFGGVMGALAGELAARKRRRFAGALQDGEGWRSDRFLFAVDFGGEGACASCGKLPRAVGELCRQCRRDYDLGAALPAARYIAFYPAENAGQLPLLGHSVAVVGTAVEIGRDAYHVQRINDATLGTVAHLPATFRYIANHVPRERPCENCPGAPRCRAKDDPKQRVQPADFDCLARRARGRPLLGFLKADVDRLGEAFVFGLKREAPAPSHDTVSRLATLSRQLDLYFGAWVEALTSSELADCYTVYSGGDDVLLVGPWDRIAALAARLREDFGRFTGNPQLTLSAGIAFVKPHTPVSRAAAEADRALEEAKLAGRDRMAMLGDVLTWPRWAFVQRQWAALGGQGEQVPNAFLYSLLRYADMWHDYRRNGNVGGLRFQPLLAYSVARNVDPRQQPKLSAWARGLVGLRVGDEAQAATFDHLRVIASLAIMSQRGGER